MDFPLGYRFSPTDFEAVKHYLMNKALGRDLPIDVIQEIDLYSYNPDQLPIDEFVPGVKNEAYFFTYNQRKYATSEGYWKETDEEEDEISDDEEIIAYKKTLVFYWGKSPDGRKSDYVMREYRLNPCLSTDDANIRNNIENLVLCKVQNLGPKNTFGKSCVVPPVKYTGI